MMVMVYLAAGIGERLRPITDNINKCLLSFGGKTLIERNLEDFCRNGGKKAVILVGHKEKMVKKVVKSNPYLTEHLEMRFIRNSFYEITGGAHSLWLARSHFRGKNAIIMDGDQLLHPKIMEKLMDSPYDSTILVDDRSKLPLDEETLLLGMNDVAFELGWPGRNYKGFDGDIRGEAIIAVRLSVNASETLAVEIDKSVRKPQEGKMEHIEAFNRVLQKHIIIYLSSDGLPWIEIDDKDDLKRAREVWRKIENERV